MLSMMEMAAYSLSSSFTPGAFLEMDVFFPPWIISWGLREKPTHFSLTWSCVTTAWWTHTFIFSTDVRCVGQVAEMLKLQKGPGRGILVLRGWRRGVFTPSHLSRAPKHEASGWAAGMGMQHFCLLGLAIKIEPILQNTAWSTILRFVPQLCI